VQIIYKLIALATFVLVFTAHAVTPQQMAAFQKLPKSQQIALAKQMGIDLNSVSGSNNAPTGDESIDYSSQVRGREELVSDFDDLESRFEPQVEELELFGKSVFVNSDLSLINQTRYSAPKDYELVVGDSLTVNLFGKESVLTDVVIDSNGEIFIGQLSPVKIAGLTLSEAKEVISKTVDREMIGAKVTVAIAELQPISVFVAGEVEHPGSYLLPPFANLTTAISMAGGVSNIASLRSVTVNSSTRKTKQFDFYDLLLNGKLLKNSALRNGDVIFVPASSRQITVEGSVKRPGIFEIKQGETYADAIRFAGGYTASAYSKRVRVRQSEAGESFKIKTIKDSRLKEFEPQDGDIISVDLKGEKVNNAVMLLGAVSRPGKYQWQEGTTLNSIFSSSMNLLLPFADHDYALVVRDNKSSTEVFQFSPQEVLTGNASFALKRQDKVIIFSRFELESEERKMLDNLAVTKNEYKLLTSQYKWQEYKARTFDEFIAPEVDENLEKEKKKPLTSEDEGISLSRPIDLGLITELEQVEGEVKLAFYSRSNLLPPLLKKLSKQKTRGKGAQIVEISGKVKYPGVYPLPKNAVVNDLILASGGLVEGAYLAKAEIARLDFDKDYLSVNNKSFNLQTALESPNQEEFLLQGRDHVNIFQIPNWQENISIALKGEVMLPGKYTIRKGETLNNVIERAGGFSEFADLDAAIFTRLSLKLKEQHQIKQLAESMKKDFITNNLNSDNSLLGGANSSNVDQMIEQLSDLEPVGRLVLDMNDILSEQTSLILEDKDTLYVPSQKQSINVIGEVFVSTSHLHKENLRVDDYIAMSGGVKDKAATDKIFVIKASGQVFIPNDNSWFAVNNVESSLSPGDTIVVPLDSQYKDNLTLWTEVTQIVYQIGVAVAAIGSL